MRLADLIAEDLVVASLGGTSRDAVIGELLDHLVAAGRVPAAARDQVAAAVHRREGSQTTGVGGGVAIPHGVSDAVEEVAAVLGVHRTGVDFASVDGDPVQLVILLVVPPNRFQVHIRTLAGIARLLNDPRLRRDVIAAQDAAAIVDVLLAGEGAGSAASRGSEPR